MEGSEKCLTNSSMKNIVIYLILLAAGFAGIYFVVQRLGSYYEEEKKAEIRKISEAKRDIMVRDSVMMIRFNAVFDSLRVIIVNQQNVDQRLDLFNKKIQKQNAELQKIYNALPDNGRPDF
jgi:hypothetical protein